jgi:hypothetical protein
LGTVGTKKAELGSFGQNWAEFRLSHSRRSSAISLPFGSNLAAIWQAGGRGNELDILELGNWEILNEE